MITNYEKLLKDFSFLPKPNIDPTFMDICHMGGDRFEERCSRILKFYLSPLEPHQLRGLLLDSLLELLQMENRYIIQNVRIINEEATEEKKRIDITVVADDFVIAIENKIDPFLYNPFKKYVRHIQQTYKHKSTQKFVVLSVNIISSEKDLRMLADYGYVSITYEDLFRVIKKNIGRYMMDCNQNYLVFLFDFMRTIEKKSLNNHMELKQFFFNNRQSINELISQYDAYGKEVLANQSRYIAEIKKQVSEKTGVVWKFYKDWDFYITFNDDSNKIGIECSFRNKDEAVFNPENNFYIYITTWEEHKFMKPYAEELEACFKIPIEYNDKDNRAYLCLPVILGPVDADKIAEIVDTLVGYYKKLKEITNRIK